MEWVWRGGVMVDVCGEWKGVGVGGLVGWVCGVYGGVEGWSGAGMGI